jgi:competence protein ComEA
VLTPAERRGASLVALLLALGAADELWRATHPRMAPAPHGLEGSANPPAAPSLAPGAEAPGLANRAEDPSTSSSRGPAGVDSGVSKRTVPAIGFVVDLNRASVAELDRLPGIGPVLARRIIDYRARHGRFSRCEELLAVPGIGPRLLERLRPYVAP